MKYRGADPMLGAPCTLVRRRRVLRTEATNRSFKTLIEAEAVTADGEHPGRSLKPVAPGTLEVELFLPNNPWGQMPFPCEPLSLHSTSRFARQANTGLAHQRALDVDNLVSPA